MPTRRIAIMNSDVATGRSMKMREGFTLPSSIVSSGRSAAISGAASASLSASPGAAGAAPRAIRVASPGNGGSGRSFAGQDHVRAISQAVGAIHDDGFSIHRAFRQRDLFVLGLSERDAAQMHRVIGIDDVDERTGRTPL